MQTGCSVERIYVHSSKFDEFVKEFVNVAKEYKVGDPRKPETSLGPVVSVASAARIRKQVKEAGKLALLVTR
jgi:acyl-CoA reductase-like NAD-dependent aldehyde dehydrogenase